MFKTLDLAQILLPINDLRTEFTAVSEDRKQVQKTKTSDTEAKRCFATHDEKNSST